MVWIAVILAAYAYLEYTPSGAQLSTGDAVRSIHWGDGDSGKLNGQRFRLAGVDAPETGSIGQRGGAQCEAEQSQGHDAKARMIALTADKPLTITRMHELDRYGRHVISLSVDGVDVASAGIDAGILQRWAHAGAKALTAKPDWCV